MPILHAKIPTGSSPEQKTALLKGLTQAVVDTIAAPLATVRVTLQEIEPAHTIVEGEIGRPMAFVSAVLITGRTEALKAALLMALSQTVESTIGVSMQDTRVHILDVPKTDLGLAGGLSAKAAGR